MTHKTAYLWGPISSFSGPLVALLLHKGWHVHIPAKSALNLFTLTPLDLQSAAYSWLERALGGREQLQVFQERLRILDYGESIKGTTYDAIIFCGLPPNFDEPRAPRAPWSASELPRIARMLKGTPIFIVSSLWGGIQPDGVVPEEFEFERRKPLSHWEGVCQQYELRLLENTSKLDACWHLIRLPLISGSTVDGSALNFSGLSTLLRESSSPSNPAVMPGNSFKLNFNPDATLWFSAANTMTTFFWRLLEDDSRPRICNLVSTQSMLNREWGEYLARALGYETLEVTDRDTWNLPSILRKMLRDVINVKTRNLFEVAGRYQYAPTLLDTAYFEQLISFGRSENWGRLLVPDQHEICFSVQWARNYFQQFLPRELSADIIKEVTRGGTTVGFVIGGDEQISFVLKAQSGQVLVQPFDPSIDRPSVCFRFSGGTLAKLVANKLSLAKALLTREVRMDGPLLDGLRVSNALSRFLETHPFIPEADQT